MLDQKKIRSHPEAVRDALRKRSDAAAAMLDEFLALDEQWRKLLVESDELKHKRKIASEEIGRMKKAGEDAAVKQEEARKLGDDIKEVDDKIKTIQEQLDRQIYFIPNIPHESVPVGKDASENKVVREWGKEIIAKQSATTFLPHWEIAENLGIIDFKRAAKLSGSMFALYLGAGAKLQRALIQFMLDFHVEKHGYTEIWPPYIVRREIMVGTGQLPKFEEDMYRCDADDLFLIPTAEVPVTNIHREEILSADELPRHYVGYTACFRREAGAAGADTRGLQRLHQFDKVELVKLSLPEKSYEAHETLVAEAEAILQALELPYRTVLLCSGDLGANAAKCYDLEAWAPAQKKWLEVSSCSNFEDYQARRANIRFRRDQQAKPEFVHTLNGSGLALPRVMIAILENYQNGDGTVRVPEKLKPYVGADQIGPAGARQQIVHQSAKKS